MRKRPRKPTVSPNDIGVKKPKVKRSKDSTKEEEWVEIPARRNFFDNESELEIFKHEFRDLGICSNNAIFN